MRIVGGEFRGKKLALPIDQRIRPTSDRTREALFNILGHGSDCRTDNGPLPIGARVLDILPAPALWGWKLSPAVQAMSPLWIIIQTARSYSERMFDILMWADRPIFCSAMAVIRDSRERHMTWSSWIHLITRTLPNLVSGLCWPITGSRTVPFW